ncbi:MAG: LCP family protein [Actinomycetota bacterium]
MNPFLGQERLTNHRRTWGQRMLLVLNVVLIGATLSAAALLNYAGERASSINRVALDRSLTELDASAPGERVINVLLVGSDSSASLDPDDPIQIGRQGERFGDVIIVAHLDERTGQVALLSLPRDLWVPIAGSDRSDRINRAFVTGGPATLIDTIEEAFGFPIHHYVNVDFAGFQGLVEAVESVEVPFDAAARDWNANAPSPRSQTGFLMAQPGCASLGPTEALAYVRSRYYQTQDADGDWVTDPTSDLGRIQRQQDFLQRLAQKAIDRGARNPLVLRDLIDTGIENVAIDHELTPALLLELGTTYRSFEPGDLQTYTFPVVDDTVGSNRVLIPQYDQAAPILELFAGAGFDHPDTVGVSVVYHPSTDGAGGDGPTRLPDDVDMVVDALDEAGFDVGEPEAIELSAGLEIRHSADGAGAAALVAAVLGGGPDGPVPVEIAGLTGRNIVVAVGPDADAGAALSRLADPAWSGDEAAASSIDEVPAGPATDAADETETAVISGPEGLPRPVAPVDNPAFTAQATMVSSEHCGS